MVKPTISNRKSDKMTRFDDEKQREKTFEDAFFTQDCPPGYNPALPMPG